MRRVTGKKEMYTGKGDGGRTSLLSKRTVSKGSHRIDILGELDEFSASLGMARALTDQADSRSILLAVQRDVYVLMGELASSGKVTKQAKKLEGERVTWLESQIDRLAVGSKMPGDSLSRVIRWPAPHWMSRARSRDGWSGVWCVRWIVAGSMNCGSELHEPTFLTARTRSNCTN